MIFVYVDNVRKLSEAVHDSGFDEVYEFANAGTNVLCLDHLVAASLPPRRSRIYLTACLPRMVTSSANSTLPLAPLVVVFMLGPPADDTHADLAVGVHVEHGFAEGAFENELVVVRSGRRQAIRYRALQTLHRANWHEDTGLHLYSHAEQL